MVISKGPVYKTSIRLDLESWTGIPKNRDENEQDRSAKIKYHAFSEGVRQRLLKSNNWLQLQTVYKEGHHEIQFSHPT